MLTLDPNDISAWRNASKLYYELNKYDEAVKAYKFVFKHNPSDISAALNLAMLLEANKKTLSSAVEVYMECFQQNPFCTIILKQIYRITGNNRYIPYIISATKIKDYKLKNHKLTLIGDISSKGRITYKYILLLYENGNIEPLYYVSLEDNTLYNSFGGPPYFLCAFTDKGHVNFGGVDNSSKEFFIKQAFIIISSNFNDIKEELAKIS